MVRLDMRALTTKERPPHRLSRRRPHRKSQIQFQSPNYKRFRAISISPRPCDINVATFVGIRFTVPGTEPQFLLPN